MSETTETTTTEVKFVVGADDNGISTDQEDELEREDQFPAHRNIYGEAGPRDTDGSLHRSQDSTGSFESVGSFSSMGHAERRRRLK